MEILIALTVYFSIWIVVIAGSIYFNKNVNDELYGRGNRVHLIAGNYPLAAPSA